MGEQAPGAKTPDRHGPAELRQCIGCPPGNSMPLLLNEVTCWHHSRMNNDNAECQLLCDE